MQPTVILSNGNSINLGIFECSTERIRPLQDRIFWKNQSRVFRYYYTTGVCYTTTCAEYLSDSKGSTSSRWWIPFLPTCPPSTKHVRRRPSFFRRPRRPWRSGGAPCPSADAKRQNRHVIHKKHRCWSKAFLENKCGSILRGRGWLYTWILRNSVILNPGKHRPRGFQFTLLYTKGCAFLCLPKSWGMG